MTLMRWLVPLFLGLTLLVSQGQAYWFGGKTRNDGEIAVSQLPPEARRTLVLIHQGGPFPYAKDGSVFGNREGLLPRQNRDYYREYTVVTPGSRDRGARRIIAGRVGEYWYTADHYRSFRRIRE
jgi:ribonuclease T1